MVLLAAYGDNMLEFLPMILKGLASQGGTSGGTSGGPVGAGSGVAGKSTMGAAGGNGILDGFIQALGASKLGKGQDTSQNIGMQYANSGLQLPPTPSASQAMGAIPQNMNQPQQRQLQTFNPLLQMLLNGTSGNTGGGQ